MFFINFVERAPERLNQNILVQADDQDALEQKIKAETKADEVRVLFIDSLDADNHDCDTFITIDGYRHKANVSFVRKVIV